MAWSLLAQIGGLGPFELVIILIILAILFLFGPQKLPQLARSVGKALGEFRRGRQEIERELRLEEARVQSEQAGPEIRSKVVAAAKLMKIEAQGRDERDLKVDIAREIDKATSAQVLDVAKVFGLPVEGVGIEALKKDIIKTLGV